MAHICSQCEHVKPFGSSDALRRHRRIHRSEAKPSWQCDKCSNPPFSRKEYLTRHHEKEKHTGESLRICDRCMRTFTKRYLEQHQETCNSRNFGEEEVSEPPTKRARINELPWDHPTTIFPLVQALPENTEGSAPQVTNFRFVRGSVAPKARKRKQDSDDESEIGVRQDAASDFSEQHWSEIYDVIKSDDIALLNQIIDRYNESKIHMSSVNKTSATSNLVLYNGESWLNLAAACGSMQVARMLLSAGVSVNSKSKDYGSTPLHEAIRHSRCEMAELLLEEGADINGRDRYGRTPLIQCCDLRTRENFASTEVDLESLDAINFLVNHGVTIDAEDDDKNTSLCQAFRSCMLLGIQRLLQAGASSNGPLEEDAPTPLMIACNYATKHNPKFLDIIKLLLRYRADINLVRSLPWLEGRRSTTALARLFAGPCPHERISEVLSLVLSVGADPNLGDKTPLEGAIIHGDLGVVPFLLDAGADSSRLSDKCISILRGRFKPRYEWHYAWRQEKWMFCQQYRPDVFGNQSYCDSDVASEKSDNEDSSIETTLEEDDDTSSDNEGEEVGNQQAKLADQKILEASLALIREQCTFPAI